MRPGVRRLLPDEVARALAARHEEVADCDWLVGMEYETMNDAYRYRHANEARGHVVYGPFVAEGVGIVNLIGGTLAGQAEQARLTWADQVAP